MRKMLLLVLITCSVTSFAQLGKRAPQQPPHERRRNFDDSVVFYNYLLRQMRSEAISKVKNSKEYQSIYDTLLGTRARSNNYVGFVIFIDGLLWNVDGLNAQLSTADFPTIKDYGGRIGFGISSKKKRRMFDLQVLAVGIQNGSIKGEEKIKHSFHSYLNFTWGYDLLASPRWSIYPYGGLGRRKTKLRYLTPVHYDPDAPFINSIIEDNNTTKLQVDRLSYLAGVEVDLRLVTHSPYATNLVFLRFGVNGPFRKEYYGIQGRRFSTGMKATVWNATVGLKLAGRN